MYQNKESKDRSKHILPIDCQQRYQSSLMERIIFSNNEIVRTSEQPHAKSINLYLIHTGVSADAPLAHMQASYIQSQCRRTAGLHVGPHTQGSVQTHCWPTCRTHTHRGQCRCTAGLHAGPHTYRVSADTPLAHMRDLIGVSADAPLAYMREVTL